MARLNDYTAPPESIEALKRRFVRQNREIARVNSMQSLRIRSLESEVSHLLAENVSLRQQVINLTQDTERLEAARTLHDGVYEIKSRLDAKLAELNELASDLGMLPRKASRLEKSDPERPKVATSRPQPMEADCHGMEDGRLPAILEDKFYPRRTLETQEIETLVHADSSPFQLSSRPELLELSHSDAQSPTPSPKVEDLSHIQLEEPNDSAPFLPPTLETRKKKKKIETTSHADELPSSRSPKIPDGGERPAKSGSKRKFSPDEDGALSDGVPEGDEFQFSRPIQSPKKSVEAMDLGNQGRSPTKTPVSIKRGTGTGNTKRKVLEPKSTNLNLNSPKKARALLHADNKISQPIGANENTVSPQKPKSLEPIKGKSLNRAARRPFSNVNAQADKLPRPSNDVDQQLRQSISRDSPVAQPEPMSIVPDESSTSRTSRRRGAVVSYAEPNLRDKMRRPTKEMIDAVGKNGARRSSSFQLEVLGEASDVSSKGQSATSPCPSIIEGSSADTSLASQSMDSSSTDMASHQLLETVSRRRQSRRHSSNPKSTTRELSPQMDVQSADAQSLKTSPGQASSLMQMDGSFDAENSDAWNSSDVNYRRETRVAARRRSMMV